MIEQIDKFNRDLLCISRSPGSIQDKTEFDWFIGVLNEEKEELIKAHTEGDFIGEIDAVIDLMYFAGGFFTRVGLPPSVTIKIFNHIHECNMKKVAGKKASRAISHNIDAIKPEDWVGPEEGIMNILDECFKQD